MASALVAFEKAINSKLENMGLVDPRVSDVGLLSNEKKHNHWIITKYKDEKDNIGFHNDKDRDFEEDSYVVVIKMGAPRLFEFRIKGEKLFWSKTLKAGTAIFMRAKGKGGNDANSVMQHGVPSMKDKVGISGSIVSRAIKTVVPWDKVHKLVKQAKTRKLKAKELKNKK